MLRTALTIIGVMWGATFVLAIGLFACSEWRNWSDKRTVRRRANAEIARGFDALLALEAQYAMEQER